MSAELIEITVDPGGSGDYLSLSSALNAEKKSLKNNNQCIKFKCKSSDGSADTVAISISDADWETDDDHWIEIGSYESDRHGKSYDSSKYRLDVSGGDCLTFDVNHLILDGIQIKSNSVIAAQKSCIKTSSTFSSENATLVIKNCMIKVDDEYDDNTCFGIFLNASNLKAQIYNNVIDGMGFEGWGIYSANAESKIRNNTIIAINSNGGRGIHASSGSVEAINNIVQGFNTCFSSTFTSNSDYNISSDATAPGSNSKKSTELTFQDKDAGDYSLSSSDEDAIGNGFDFSNDTEYYFLTDIINNFRLVWDIGAFAYELSKRSQILAAIRSRLKEIKKINGFSNDISSANFYFKDYSQLSNDDFPSCWMITGRSQYHPLTQQQYTSGGTLNGIDGWAIGIIGYVKADKKIDILTYKMESMIKDIVETILYDHTLGLSFVRNCYLIDVNPVTDYEQNTGIVMVNFAVKYDVNKSDF